VTLHPFARLTICWFCLWLLLAIGSFFRTYSDFGVLAGAMIVGILFILVGLLPFILSGYNPIGDYDD